MKGKELVDMKALRAAGAAGFTDDGIPLLEEETARAAMEAAAAEGVPISFHEENPAFIQNNGINAGKASAHFGIGGSDRQAEIDMVEPVSDTHRTLPDDRMAYCLHRVRAAERITG